MNVKIKLFATLSVGRFSEKTISLQNNLLVSDILRIIGVNTDDAAIIFINGRHAQLEQVVSDGDTVSIFPPIGGG